MNIDEFIRANDTSWARLAELTKTVRGRPKRLRRAERSEFLHLYQLTSAHLSQLRSGFADPQLDARLTRLVADANGALYGQKQAGSKTVILFFNETFPAAVWHARRFHMAAAILFFAPAVLLGTWLGTSSEAQGAVPPALAETYVNEDFEAYYSTEAASEFATTVFINNIWVSFLAFAVGVAFCVGTAYVLISNGIVLGQAAGLFASAGELDKFFGLILPHGMLELSAIIIAGGSGLVLGWAVISPGDRTRADALAEEGRRAVVIVLGLIGVFLAAALIEGFVTGSPLSTAMRVGIGAVSWLAFVLYIATYGRRAEALGRSGLWGESRPSWEAEPRIEFSPRATVKFRD